MISSASSSPDTYVCVCVCVCACVNGSVCAYTDIDKHRHRQTQTDVHRHTLHTHTHVYIPMCTSIPRYCMHVRNSTCECTVLLKRDSHDTRGPLSCHVCSHFCLFFSLSLLLRLSLPPSPFLSALVQPGAGVAPNFAMYKHSAVRWATRFCHDTPRDLPALQADDSISITVHPPGVSRTVAG